MLDQLDHLATATFNMSVAMACGAVIGVERQVRRRKAGLRTNALVALGAAAFVVFSMTHEADTSPSRVAAQVVSGIGFLGAGIIFRDGMNVMGLTTAATLWCAGAVGVMAGGGYWPEALVTTALVVFVNLGLRPLAQWMKRRIGTDDIRRYGVTVEGPAAREAEIRGLMLRTLGLAGWQVSTLAMAHAADGTGIALSAEVSGEDLEPHDLDHAVARLSVEPGLTSVRWKPIGAA
jgi:putative Mg2+ transporter-C (MgtC) family protein